MKTEEETDTPPGCRPIVEEKERCQLILLMAEYFQVLGYTNIKARISDYVHPPVLSGTAEDHRPDLMCIQLDKRHTPIFLEAITKKGMSESAAHNRWALFSSAAQLYKGEFHLVVQKFDLVSSLESIVRGKLQAFGISFKHIWNV